MYESASKRITGRIEERVPHLEKKVTIANISVSNAFIVADIVDEVIIGAEFMIAHGISLNMGQQIMSWRNMEIPFEVGCKPHEHVKRIVAVEQQKLQPQNESFIWTRIKGDCEENKKSSQRWENVRRIARISRNVSQDQQDFSGSVEKWVAGLAISE